MAARAAPCYTSAPVPALSLALVGSLVLGPPPEPGATDDFALDWQAPASCPNAAWLDARIAALLAESPRAGARIEARARVESIEGRYEAALELRSGDDPPGLRELGDPDCAELAEGVALIIALAVDPELFAAPRDPSEGETGVGGEGEAHQRGDDEDGREGGRGLARHEAAHSLRLPVPEIEVVAAPTVSPAPTISLGAYALAGVGFATLPGASARVHAGMLVAGDHYRLEFGLSGWPPRAIVDARYQAWALELAGCGVPSVGIVEFPLCARIELGAMIGESLAPEGRRALAPWLAATPGVGLVVRPRATRTLLGLIVRADAILPLTRPAFATDEGSLLLRIDFGAQVLVGVELRVPARRREPTRAGSSRAMLGRASGGHPRAMPGRSP